MDPASRAIELARRNVEEGGRPFACVIVRNGELVAEGPNLVAQTHDPTAHAEIVAIRAACTKLQTETLSDCEIYALSHPCPMCLGAIYYCSPARFVFFTTKDDYASYYRDDRKYFELESFYAEYAKDWRDRRLPMEHRTRPDALEVFLRWHQLNAPA
jgi:guanine deaminase